MTKTYECMGENEKNDLATMNSLTQSEPLVETLIKRHQTSKKSTSGLLKYSNPIQQQSFLDLERRTNSRSVSNDSLINGDETSASSTQPGLKLVLKRATGSRDKYEVKNNTTSPQQLSMSLNEKMFLPLSNQASSSTSTRPKREASRKVKFIFKDYETDFDNLPSARKKLKLNSDPLSNSMNESHTSFNAFIRQNSLSNYNTTQITTYTTINNNNNNFKHNDQRKINDQIKFKSCVIPTPSSQSLFTTSEITQVCKEEKLIILKNQPKVVLTRSIPLPIALVEDKTNVVYTKALLFLHLFVSYLSPCINCPWCNKYLNVSEFSKHLHIDQIDDEDEDDDEEEGGSEESEDSSSEDLESKTEEERQAFLTKRRKKKRFLKLVKKSFKILPYCVNSSEELSEEEIRRWKSFGDKFSTFKQRHLRNLKEQQLLNKTQSKQPETALKQREEIQIKKFNDWDHIDQNGKYFVIKNERLISDSIVYLESENAIETNETIDDKIDDNVKLISEKDIRRSNSDDVFLSEDEEKEGDVESGSKTKKISTSSTNKTSPIDLTEMMIDENQISDSKSLARIKKPSLVESFFNLYDNLPKETLIYINKNQFTIVPISFLNYCDVKRRLKLKRLKLAKTNQLKIIWLCLTLDLEC